MPFLFGKRRPAQPIAEPSPAERIEIDLIARVAQGDMRALEALYRLYHPRLARFVQRMTRQGSLIDELVNDVMLVVWRRADRFNGSSKVSTWIFGIAYLKALKAVNRFDAPLEEMVVDEVPDAQPAPDDAVYQRQLRARLDAVMGELPVEQRLVVDLTYFQGMSYREIADVMECPVDTVKTRMFHARRKLRAAMSERMEDWG